MVLSSSMQTGYSLRTFMGHSATVMSLDFHPNKDDLISSCDSDGEIRYWNITNGSCARVFKVSKIAPRFRLQTLNIFSFYDINFIIHPRFICVMVATGRDGTGEIPTPFRKIPCRCCREHCVHTRHRDSNVPAYLAGTI